ncbi:hypothetical protein Gorai_008331, partial [Gossypium raimondii]|nr:hypothetical protein [Gossypium raimondii]
MWRRLLTSQLKTLATAPCRSASKTVPLPFKSNVSSSPFSYLLTRHFSASSEENSYSILINDFSGVLNFWTGFGCVAASAVKKTVEDVMPIATGHEREELEVELQGKKILEDVNNPVGPFGTK